MQLRTELKLPKSDVLYDYESNFLFLGSCFSDHIGKKLQDLKFNCTVNPFGTLFNPISIFKAATSAPDLNDDLIYEISTGVFVHHHYHSDLFAFSRTELKKKLTQLFNADFQPYLKKQNLIVLTFGTAIVHQLKNEKELVANCHKRPKNDFNKRFLEIEEIVTAYQGFDQLIANNTQVILTVSPVRHTKQGLEDNQLSKSILRVACAQLAKKYPNVSYFPSYEIMIDDLRDYRFYKSDLIHPNDLAIHHIFDQFIATHFSSQSIKESNGVKKLINEINHTPLFENSKSHLNFLTQLHSKLTDITVVDFSKEITDLATKIKTLG